jgi:hypothetical protein
LRTIAGILAIGLLMGACTRALRMIDLRDGSTIIGSTTLWTRTISVTLPSGEIAEGTFLPLHGAHLGHDSLFRQTNLGALFGGRVSGRFHGYAYLQGTAGTVVEIVFATDWLSGVGLARTSRGQEYQVSF